MDFHSLLDDEQLSFLTRHLTLWTTG